MATNGLNSPVPKSYLKQKQMLDMQNKAVVDALYKGLVNGHTQTAAKFLASDLEWWFHGPRQCQHMMWVLTGKSVHTDFRFKPRRIEVVGDYVIAEGWEEKNAYWVHVWTLKDGIIVQLKEYFNTWLTVRKIRPKKSENGDESNTLWQSQPKNVTCSSLPGLLLAI
ncbi:wound-induced protein 1-like [Tripterygium wilfordii]|uniref:Wound-induced protein 1-like n=1 Tax=Tripterygium wilfordii TaxID=458696 RepID=A0A7J7DMU5_TRIWF|nr:wound-induced protein 1-like [Tripterygium wilfordii]KAF5747658.1 wound-induced protein 1-like [Tripterygium wilfordii]